MGGGGEQVPTTTKGRAGEQRAVALLLAAGYVIVERNWRCAVGELDVVARDGDVLCFVEIRTRSRADRGSALETVGAAKQRRLARVAEAYLAIRRPRARAMRFDVVGITAGEPVLIKDAFRLG
ncbi:MAG: YraN family protein [Kofleriaceae bacterium]|nr:YraN family protein [Myxococcales bacterium]MCB9572619.1 YraN family protein [Kofleriaceae bacterium]